MIEKFPRPSRTRTDAVNEKLARRLSDKAKGKQAHKHSRNNHKDAE